MKMSCMLFGVIYAIFCLICFFTAFLSGYMFASFRAGGKSGNMHSEPDEKTENELLKRQREYENFMNYDGSRQ